MDFTKDCSVCPDCGLQLSEWQESCDRDGEIRYTHTCSSDEQTCEDCGGPLTVYLHVGLSGFNVKFGIQGVCGECQGGAQWDDGGTVTDAERRKFGFWPELIEE